MQVADISKSIAAPGAALSAPHVCNADVHISAHVKQAFGATHQEYRVLAKSLQQDVHVSMLLVALIICLQLRPNTCKASVYICS